MTSTFVLIYQEFYTTIKNSKVDSQESPSFLHPAGKWAQAYFSEVALSKGWKEGGAKADPNFDSEVGNKGTRDRVKRIITQGRGGSLLCDLQAVPHTGSRLVNLHLEMRLDMKIKHGLS